MRKYFKLESSNYIDYGIQSLVKLDGQSVFSGRNLLSSQLPELKYEHNFPSSEDIPHLLTGGTVLASQKLIDVFKTLSITNFQAFPVLLVNSESKEIRQDYFLFNVLGLCNQTDLPYEDYQEINIEIDCSSAKLKGARIKKIATDHSCQSSKINRPNKSFDLFRLAEEPISIVVSDRVITALRQQSPNEGWGVIIESL